MNSSSSQTSLITLRLNQQKNIITTRLTDRSTCIDQLEEDISSFANMIALLPNDCFREDCQELLFIFCLQLEQFIKKQSFNSNHNNNQIMKTSIPILTSTSTPTSSLDLTLNKLSTKQILLQNYTSPTNNNNNNNNNNFKNSRIFYPKFTNFSKKSLSPSISLNSLPFSPSSSLSSSPLSSPSSSSSSFSSISSPSFFIINSNQSTKNFKSLSSGGSLTTQIRPPWRY